MLFLCFGFGNKKKALQPWLRRMGSNQRPSGYEPDELPLLYSAIFFPYESGCKGNANI